MYDYKSDKKQLSAESEMETFEGLENISSDFKLQKGSLPQWAVDWSRKKFNMDTKNVKFYIMDEMKANSSIALAGGNSIFVNPSHKNDEEVIKHELTHIYQQAIGSAKKSNANDPKLEKEAIDVSNGRNPDISKNSKFGQNLVTPKENTGVVQGFYGSAANNNNKDRVVVIRPSYGTVLTADYARLYSGYERIKIDERVTKIDDRAFESFDDLITIDMPNVTEIGNSAFYDCTNLKEINMPNVKEIGYSAFYDCADVKEINMPNVTKIGSSAFEYCGSLIKLDITNVKEIDSSAFKYCVNLIKVDMPNVTIIEESTFNGCKRLEKINMPSVTKICDKAFGGCENLITTDMPNVTKIGYGAFYDCINLKEINMPNVKEIDSSAFEHCGSLIKVDIPNAMIIGESTFNDCKKLEKINMPSVTNICDKAFRGCENLITIDVPNVTKIGSSAFDYCTNLKEINMPNIKQICGSAFDYCTSLSSVNMQNAKIVNGSAFKGLVKLRSVNISNAEEIGRGAFISCTSLSSVEMPSVTQINDGAFWGCTSLSSVYMPNVTNIRMSAFTNCPSLESIDIPNVTEICMNAFLGCTSLSNVNISSVMKIGKGAFARCINLKKVSVPGSCDCDEFAFPDDCKIEYKDMPNISDIDKLKLMQFYETGKIKPGDCLKDIDISTIDFADENNYYLLMDALYSESVKLADIISKFNIKPEKLLGRHKYGFDIYDAYIKNWIAEDEIKRLMPDINIFSKMNTEGETRYYVNHRINLGCEFKAHLPNFERFSKIPENIISEFSKTYRGNSSLWKGMRSGIYQYSDGGIAGGQVLTSLISYMRNTGDYDIKLYRGVKDYETVDYMANMPIGSFKENYQYIEEKEIFDRSLTSTTISKDIAKGYAGIKDGNKTAVLLEITVPKGRKLNMMPIANHNDEVVFNKFQKLKVKKVGQSKEGSNMVVIECEAIEDKDNLCKTEKDIYESSEFKKYQEEFEVDLGKYLYKSDEAYAAVQKGINILKERNSEEDLRKIFFSNERYTMKNFSGNVTELGGKDLTDEELEALLRDQKPTDEELKSLSTTVAGNLREKLGAFQFAVDNGTLGYSNRYRKPDELEPHIERRDRANEDQEKLRRDFDYQDNELQLFRSARERRYQETFQNNGKTQITYGGMLFQPQYKKKDIESFYGKRLVAGTSGTAMRLLSKYREQISSDKTDLLNFRLVLMACMLPERNHSLYEILQGSHEVGVKGYENLATADTMDKTIDPLGEDRVRKHVCKDQKFPYERALKDYSEKNMC